MKEFYNETKNIFRKWFLDYGKVSIVLITSFLIVGCLLFIVFGSRPGVLKISFLDIGQGDAILIQTPSHHNMIIDGGPSNRVLEKLGQKINYFDRHVDVVLETHPDADHITGLIPVLEKYSVDTIITSPLSGHTGIFDELEKYINEEHADVRVGKKGDEIDFGDGVVVHILYPSSYFHGNEKETNDASVSLIITYGDESVLLTGDLPSTHEGELLSALIELQSIHESTDPHMTIYKAGHHGSKYSSGDQLLSYVKPDYAVISVGKDNKYGHPNPEAISRLETYSKNILSTIDHGTITFALDGENVAVSSEK